MFRLPEETRTAIRDSVESVAERFIERLASRMPDISREFSLWPPTDALPYDSFVSIRSPVFNQPLIVTASIQSAEEDLFVYVDIAFEEGELLADRRVRILHRTSPYLENAVSSELALLLDDAIIDRLEEHRPERPSDRGYG